jgi:dTDP-4-dehydrorhamnose reductase
VRKILITGAAGLLGQYLVNLLKSGNELLCIDLAKNPFGRHQNVNYLWGELTEFDSVKSDICRFDPEIIINCAACSNVDRCEREKKRAQAVNVALVENLLDLPSRKFIQYSTDYVFNGLNGPYAEDDPVDPIAYYGLTKLQAERLLQESGKDYLIIRTNALYGFGKAVRPNFVTWIIDSLRQGKYIHIVTDQYNNPTYAGNLAEASLEAVNLGLSGILNIAGADFLSRYDMALTIADIFDLPTTMVHPISTSELGQIARRPARGGQKIDKAKALLKTKLLGLEEGLKLMADY